MPNESTPGIIYQASRQAMTAALNQLSMLPDYLLLDAIKLDVLIEQKSLIHGDARSVSIAAASILAKTHRDARMLEWDAIYPQYGLARHKGYGYRRPFGSLRQHGPSPLHRHSFAPVRESNCWAVVRRRFPFSPRWNLRIRTSFRCKKNSRTPQLRFPALRLGFATKFPVLNGITACSHRTLPAIDLSFSSLLA